jgi:hypothetical protein
LARVRFVGALFRAGRRFLRVLGVAATTTMGTIETGGAAATGSAEPSWSVWRSAVSFAM